MICCHTRLPCVAQDCICCCSCGLCIVCVCNVQDWSPGGAPRPHAGQCPVPASWSAPCSAPPQPPPFPPASFPFSSFLFFPYLISAPLPLPSCPLLSPFSLLSFLLQSPLFFPCFCFLILQVLEAHHSATSLCDCFRTFLLLSAWCASLTGLCATASDINLQLLLGHHTPSCELLLDLNSLFPEDYQ